MLRRLRFVAAVSTVLVLANSITIDCYAFTIDARKNIGPTYSHTSTCLWKKMSTTPLYNDVTQVQENENNDGPQGRRRFMYMTKEQDQLLKEKGDYERGLMKKPVVLKPNKVRGVAGGFGGTASGKTKKTPKSTSGPSTTSSSSISGNGSGGGGSGSSSSVRESLMAVQSHAKALASDGLVRIDNVLTSELADALRDYLCDLRARAITEIEKGIITDTQERFADVLLNQNRCDLKVPLGPPPVNNALHHLLAKEDGSSCIVRDVMEYVFESYGGIGKDAELWELNCFMSNSGARRQLVHADNVVTEPVVGLKNEKEPIVLTCFVALQDIDETMGPTIWMPGTHTLQAHNQFFETGIDKSSTCTDSYSPKDDILQSSKAVVGAIPKGACVIFDPRVLHCAGANTCSDPDKTRALFYVSFKNPKIDNPGCPSTSGYGVSTAGITMEDLTIDLKAEQEGRPTRRIQSIACFP